MAANRLAVSNGAASAAAGNNPVKENGSAQHNKSKSYGYEQTLMSGHYVTEDLAEIARHIQAERLKQQQILTHKSREEIEKARIFEQSGCYRCLSGCGSFTRMIVNKIGEDWVFLFMLGAIMALLSFTMDYCIAKLLEAHEVIYEETGRIHPAFSFITWIAFPVVLILFSTYFVHLVAPNAIGSGIPEMKTILRGVVLKEYLTFRTLGSKMVGLTTSLGSGLPFGKEGPFVHIASIVATLLSKWVSSFRGIYENESRNNEMLAAAAATGVACTFAAPIGGVLFSIEVTATYFAVRNYWRGFFAAVCAAILFRLCAILFEGEDTVTALFKTTLRHEFPFDALELLAFAAIGIASGFAGALFVWIHRKFIFLMRRNKKFSSFLQSYRFIYPLVVTVIITAATCPQSLGQYMGGGITFKQALTDFFANVTWSDPYNEFLTVDEQRIIARWDNPSIWVSLPVYMIFVFLMAAVAITLPVPSGVFIPVFAIGAAFGRLIGEAMYVWFPQGINNGHSLYAVVPGGYAVVGAAALSGAVTHTISTSMIVFELTGQMSHILPAVLAVLIANAIANILQPSIYDSIIQIKRLPYLPNFLPTNSNAHRICAEDIMLRDVKTISYETTYEEVRQLLTENEALRSFPLVDSINHMILLGSVQRVELIRLLELHLGRETRQTLSQSGETAAEVVNEKINKKTNGYKKKGARRRGGSSPKSTTSGTSSDDETDVRRDRALQVIAERGDTDKVYQTIGAPERARSPTKSILKKSSTNPDLLSEVKRQASPARDRSPGRTGKKVLPLSQLFKSRHRASLEALDQSDEHSTVSEAASLLSSEADTADTADGRVRFVESPFRQMRWEAEQLSCKLDFDECQVDPAPFQLVEKTSLYKVHSLFSLLGLNHAYVTNVGKLVGVVSLKELQKIMIELLSHHPIPDSSDTVSDTLSAHSVNVSPSVTLSDLSRPLDPIGEDNESYVTEDYCGSVITHRDMLDSRSARFSPAVLRKAISGPSIIDEQQLAKPGLIKRQTTLTSTVGGVNLEYEPASNGRVDESSASLSKTA